MDDAQAAKLRALAEKTDRDAYARGQHLVVLIAPDELLALLDEREGYQRQLELAKAANRIIADERDALRRERDSAMTAYEAARQDARNLTEKVLPNVRSERDAAMALLRECREQFALGYAAWRDELPLVERIDALLGDGGEA